MTREPADSLPAVDPRLANTLWQWLALGVLALGLWPSLRGATAFGWGPYWLVVAPALALAVAYRHRLVANAAPAERPATSHRRRARGDRVPGARMAMAARRNARLRVA